MAKGKRHYYVAVEGGNVDYPGTARVVTIDDGELHLVPGGETWHGPYQDLAYAESEAREWAKALREDWQDWQPA